VNLDPTETQALLQQSVRQFLEARAPFDRIRDLEAKQDWDAALWREVCEQGFPGLSFAEVHGGGGGGLLDLGLLVEEFARRAVMVPLLEVVVAGRSLEACEDLAEEALSALLAGQWVAVPAILERADSFDHIETAVDAGGRIRGEKYFVDYGQCATHHLVAARRSDAGGAAGEVGLHLVEVADAGVRSTPLRSVGRTPVCRVEYRDALSRPVGDARALADLICLARALAALQCVGSMQTSLDMAVEYAGIREQFGQLIGRFQAVRHHCANMASRVASARLLAFEALSALDRGERDELRVAAAKAAASRAAPEVLMLSHQVHGGNGVIEENDLYFFTLRGKERALAWGSVEECLGVMAASVDRPRDWF
jgi:alkylation response protein AidB-like acyl-CoA dehydrogenase